MNVAVELRPPGRSTSALLPVAIWSKSRPGVIQPAERARIVSGLVSTMPSYGVAQYFSVKGAIFDTCDVVVIAESTELSAPVAMLAARWMVTDRGKLLHVQTLLIGEDWQRTTVIRQMWRRLFEELLSGSNGFPFVIALTTYNPKSFAAMAGFTLIPGTRMFPALRGGELGEGHLSFLRCVAATLNPGCRFDEKTGVITGGAGEVSDNFYRTLPLCGKAWIDDHFIAHVTPKDRVLCCLFVETTEAAARILHAFGVSRELQIIPGCG
jgi:hypothetical protein